MKLCLEVVENMFVDVCVFDDECLELDNERCMLMNMFDVEHC